MRSVLQYAVLIFVALQLVACGSTYRVTTVGGETYYAQERPEIDRKTDQLVFEDPQGNEVILERDKVDVIQEADIPKDQKQFDIAI